MHACLNVVRIADWPTCMCLSNFRLARGATEAYSKTISGTKDTAGLGWIDILICIAYDNDWKGVNFWNPFITAEALWLKIHMYEGKLRVMGPIKGRIWSFTKKLKALKNILLSTYFHISIQDILLLAKISQLRHLVSSSRVFKKNTKLQVVISSGR